MLYAFNFYHVSLEKALDNLTVHLKSTEQPEDLKQQKSYRITRFRYTTNPRAAAKTKSYYSTAGISNRLQISSHHFFEIRTGQIQWINRTIDLAKHK